MDGHLLQNGKIVPYIGYGTGVVNCYTKNPSLWLKNESHLVLNSIKHLKLNRQLKIDLFASQMVLQAYKSGFRLFDTGRIYGYSEKAIGNGLAAVPRENYYLITKFSDLCFQMSPMKGYTSEDIIGHLQKSLQYLKTDYVDLLLIHHPHGSIGAIWSQMEAAYEKGLCKAIGTSNFDVQDLLELKKTQKIAPMVNQGERHPFFQNSAVFDYCKKNSILFVAHTSTGRGKGANNDVLKSIATHYRKTTQQIILRWHYQNGVVPIISTTDKVHMKDSTGIFNFQLSEEDIKLINGLEDGIRLLDCQNGPDNLNYRYNL